MQQIAQTLIVFWMITLSLPDENYKENENLSRSSYAQLRTPWYFEHISESGWTVMNYLSGPISETAKYSGIGADFIKDILNNYLRKSPALLAFLVACSVLSAVLMFSSCMLYSTYCRHRSHEVSSDTNNTLKIWLYIFLLLLTIAIGLFGASLCLLGEHQMSKHLQSGFNLANHIVESTYYLKNSFLEQLSLMTDHTSEVANKLLSSLDLLGNCIMEFRKSSLPYTSPIITETFNADINLDRLLFSLKDMKKDVLHLINNSTFNLNNDILLFNGILDSIKSDVHRQLSMSQNIKEVLWNIEKLPEIGTNINEVYRQFDGPIEKLQELVSKNIHQNLVGLESNLTKAVDDLSLDFTSMMKGMKNSVFETEAKLKEIKNNIFSGANNLYPLRVKNELLRVVNRIKYSTTDSYSAISVGLLVIAIIAILLTLPFLIGVILCLSGTYCMTKFPGSSESCSTGYGVKILWGSSFSVSTVVFMFWILSIAVFTYSLLPVIFCHSMENLNILDITTGNIKFWNDLGYDGYPWRDTFPSYIWNLNFKDTLLRCKNDSGLYHALNLHEVFGTVHVNFTKVDIRFDYMKDDISKTVAAIPQFDSEVYNDLISGLNGSLDGIDINTFFSNITKLARTAVKQHSDSVLKSTSKHPSVSQPLNTKLFIAAELLADIKANSSTLSLNKMAFTNNFFALKNLKQQILENIQKIQGAGKEYNTFFKSNGASVMLADINRVASRSVKGVQFGIEHELYQLQEKMTNCLKLWKFYERAAAISCFDVLYGVMAIWLGMSIFTIMLVPIVIICVSLVIHIEKKMPPVQDTVT